MARGLTALGLVLVVAGIGAYWLSRPEPIPPVIGVVRPTEVRIAPEVAGQLARIKVHKGDRVSAGDVVAELSAEELEASVGQARAALAAATADRNNVYAGVRAEQIASLTAEIAKTAWITLKSNSGAPRTWRAARPLRSRRSIRRKTTRPRRVPTSRRRKPIMTPRSPARPKRSGASRMRKSRRQ
jgi:multidrug efflux pump subunit AcrA (membrane-fusion protein)